MSGPLQFHHAGARDELVLEVLESVLERVKAKVLERVAGVAKLEVPLVAEPRVGENWKEVH